MSAIRAELEYQLEKAHPDTQQSRICDLTAMLKELDDLENQAALGIKTRSTGDCWNQLKRLNEERDAFVRAANEVAGTDGWAWTAALSRAYGRIEWSEKERDSWKTVVGDHMSITVGNKFGPQDPAEAKVWLEEKDRVDREMRDFADKKLELATKALNHGGAEDLLHELGSIAVMLKDHGVFHENGDTVFEQVERLLYNYEDREKELEELAARLSKFSQKCSVVGCDTLAPVMIILGMCRPHAEHAFDDDIPDPSEPTP